MRTKDSNRALSHLVILIGAIIAIGTLYFARVVFVPFALAVVFAFLLAPAVTLLDRVHVPRTASSLAVVTVAMLALGVLGWIATPQLVDVANQLPAYRSNIKRKVESLHGWRDHGINKAASAVDEIKKDLVAPSAGPENTKNSTGLTGMAGGGNSSGKPTRVEIVPPASSPLESLDGLVGPATTVGIVIVFTLFILIRREDLRNRFIRLVGHGHLNVLTQALDEASSKVSRYLFLQLSLNMSYGLVIGFGLYAIGIPHAVLWGVAAALLRFLPYIGAPLSAVLPTLLSLTMFTSWKYPVLTLALYVVADLILGNVIEPLVYGPRVGLSSLAILVAAVFWTVLWGPIGLVISTPLTVCLVVIGRYVPDLAFLNILLGDEPVLPPASHFYQRLLAHDQHEAKQVLETYLKENDLQRLYDSVLMPALALAERDRHHNDLDEDTEQFITSSTRELIEELDHRSHGDGTNEIVADGVRDAPEKSRSSAASGSTVPQSPQTIVCIPSRDDADEIAGMMLVQLLEQIGHRARYIPLGSKLDLGHILSTQIIDGEKAGIICISALPPFALSHARSLYMRLRAHSQASRKRILIGLWGFSGDTTKMAAKIHLREGDGIFVRLDQVLAEVNRVTQTSEDPDSASLVRAV